jgi:hypothetical protein
MSRSIIELKGSHTAVRNCSTGEPVSAECRAPDVRGAIREGGGSLYPGRSAVTLPEQ